MIFTVGQRNIEWRVKMKNKPLTKVQKKYIDRMLNTKVKAKEELDRQTKKEDYEKHLNYIKDKISPNGGRKPFKTN